MNMSIVLVLQELAGINDRVSTLVGEVKEFIKGDAPIEDRWKAYLLIEDRLPESGTMVDCRGAEKDLGKDVSSPYDDFNMDSGVTKKHSELVEQLLEESVDESDQYRDACNTFAALHGVDYTFQVEGGREYDTEQQWKFGNKLENFRNDIMKTGCGSCCNDW